MNELDSAVKQYFSKPESLYPFRTVVYLGLDSQNQSDQGLISALKNSTAKPELGKHTQRLTGRKLTPPENVTLAELFTTADRYFHGAQVGYPIPNSTH